MLKCLKCNKCSSSKLPKIEIKEIKDISQEISDECASNLTMRLKTEGITEDELNAMFETIEDYTEADAIEFLSDDNSEGHKKITNYLFNKDITNGSVFCVDCGDEKYIKDRVLHLL